MKALKLILTLCIFSLALTSYSQTTGGKSGRVDGTTGGSVNESRCDSAVTTYWDGLVSRGFRNAQEYDAASDAILQKMSQEQLYCLNSSVCAGALSDLNDMAGQIGWTNRDEYVGAIQKVIGHVAVKHPNCLNANVVGHINNTK